MTYRFIMSDKFIRIVRNIAGYHSRQVILRYDTCFPERIVDFNEIRGYNVNPWI